MLYPRDQNEDENFHARDEGEGDVGAPTVTVKTTNGPL